MSKDLTEQFRTAIEQDSIATDIETIESRSCESEDYDGREYNFFGIYVPIRPILDVVAEEDGAGIESIAHVQDGDHVCLTVFVADLTAQEHPAFV